MKNIVELTKEANQEFDKKLKLKDTVYDESDRKNFVFGYIGSAYQELFEKLNKIKHLLK